MFLQKLKGKVIHVVSSIWEPSLLLFVHSRAQKMYPNPIYMVFYMA